MNKYSDLLDKLEKCLSNLKQTTLAGPNYHMVNKLCSEWLKLNGYSVKEPIEYPNKIKNLNELISLFYILFQQHYPDYNVPFAGSGRDKKIAKLFIESRMLSDGISKHKAIEQCATLIETVFKHKELFNFDSPPNFGIFGQQNMGWVTTKAIDLLNKDLAKLQKARIEKMVEEQTALVEKTMKPLWTEEEIDKALERLKGD